MFFFTKRLFQFRFRSARNLRVNKVNVPSNLNLLALFPSHMKILNSLTVYLCNLTKKKTTIAVCLKLWYHILKKNHPVNVKFNRTEHMNLLDKNFQRTSSSQELNCWGTKYENKRNVNNMRMMNENFLWDRFGERDREKWACNVAFEQRHLFDYFVLLWWLWIISHYLLVTSTKRLVIRTLKHLYLRLITEQIRTRGFLLNI